MEEMLLIAQGKYLDFNVHTHWLTGTNIIYRTQFYQRWYLKIVGVKVTVSRSNEPNQCIMPVNIVLKFHIYISSLEQKY